MSQSQTLQTSLPSLGRIIQRFWPQIRKQWSLLIGSFLAVLAEIGLRLLQPWPLKIIFDYIIPTTPPESTTGIAMIDTLDSMALLTLASLAVIVITSLRAVAAYANKVGLALVGQRALTEIRGQLYRHIQRLSLSFHTKTKSGDLIVRLIGDIGRLKEVTVTAALPLFVHFLTLACMLGVMFWLNWQLTLVALAPFPLFLLRMVRLTERIRDAARKQRKRQGAMAATAVEAIGAIKVVQALSLEKTLAHAFSRQNKKNLKEGVKTKRLTAGLERTVDVLVALGTGLVLWYGTRLVLRGQLTPGDLLVFIAYLKNAFRPMRDVAKYTGRIAKAAASGERILDILDTVPEIRDKRGAVPAPHFQGRVRFENVSFAYEPGHYVLKELNFEVQPGQRIALVGPSGAGKSTLVSLLLRLYDPSQGRIVIDGHNVRDYTIESVRPQIGIVLQDSVLFAVSARDNIVYGALDATLAEIESAAHLANAHDFIEALPQGYDTILGERGATLSGGERQRIAIARTAVRRSPIVILDEPTTGLDKKNEHLVTEALERLTKGRTIFLIAHNLQSVEYTDQILYLEDGRVVECGNHTELMGLGGRYATMHALQLMSNRNGSTGSEQKEISYALAG